MSQVERTEQDMLQYGGGRSQLGLNLKVFVQFPNMATTIVQEGGSDDDISGSPTNEDGGEDTDHQAFDTANEGGEDTI